jgi:hypothetical protein
LSFFCPSFVLLLSFFCPFFVLLLSFFCPTQSTYKLIELFAVHLFNNVFSPRNGDECLGTSCNSTCCSGY